MGVRIVVGPAGSGKTADILAEICEHVSSDPFGPPLYLVCPDQATFAAERLLLAHVQGGAAFRAKVTSFGRLAQQVRRARGAQVPALRRAGAYASLVAAYESVRRDLRAYVHGSATAGFYARLLDLIEECLVYRQTPEQLLIASSGAARDGMDELANKLRDLALLSQAYAERLQGRFTVSYDLLPEFAAHVGDVPETRGARYYLDAFLGFTAAEYELIEALCRTAREVVVAVTAQPGDAGDVDLHFVEAQRMVARLQQAAAAAGATCTVLRKGGSFRFFRPGLKLVERTLLAPELSEVEQEAVGREDVGTGVSFLAARDPQAEAYAVARALWQWRERGVAWQRMLVVASDLTMYARSIGEAFADAGIPYFLDERRPLLHHPVAALVVSVLAVASGRDESEAILRALKTDFFPLSRSCVDTMQRYVQSAEPHGLRDWERVAREGAAPARVCRGAGVVAATLAPWVQELRRLEAQGELRAPALAGQVSQLLERLHVPARVDRAAAQVGADAAAKALHARAVPELLAILEEFSACYQEEPVTIAQALEFLRMALEAATVALIPPALGQVAVTDVMRVRGAEADVVCVLGCVDGRFPIQDAETELLSDRERAHLQSSGFALAPGADGRHEFAMYRLYASLTRAREHMLLSWSEQSAENRPLVAAPVVLQLRARLASAPLIRYGFADAVTEPQSGELFTVGLAARHVAVALRDMSRVALEVGAPSATTLALYRAFSRELLPSSGVRPLLAGLAHRIVSERLPKALAAELYGADMQLSASRVERMFSCAFAHFAMYGLRLEPIRIGRFDPRVRGQLLHAVLQGFLSELRPPGATDTQEADEGDRTAVAWATLSDDDVRDRCHRAYVRACELPTLQTALATGAGRREAERVKRAAELALLTLTEHARRGKFEPWAAEVRFGEGAGVPAFSIPLEDGTTAWLRGQIDRLDLVVVGDDAYIRVIDFKSSSHRVKPLLFASGIDLQLPLYAVVAQMHAPHLVGRDARVAGLFYMHVTDVVPSVTGPDAPRPPSPLRLQGVFVGDEQRALLADRQLATRNDLFPRLLKAAGEFRSDALALSDQEWGVWSESALELVRVAATRMKEGRTDIDPYQHRADTACDLCDMRPLCAFEIGDRLGRYRRPQPLVQGVIAT
ncbi:MAG: PD-(D/E)XK nuclease family protein [Firmicutes bacterium]|nr:PD-(D/E)XK nuclease family protein [Bacillota bacterium]